MKKLILLLLICSIIPSKLFSQNNVGIGTTTPNVSAVLDLTSTDKGLLIPRVALTAINNALPVATPATSLLVYNTTTAGVAPNNVVPGFYYWDGTKWVQVGTGSAAPACVKLDEAYNCGGAGVGRKINANAGAVEINVAASVPPTTTGEGLLINIANGTVANPTGGVYVSHTGAQGGAFYGEITNTANQYNAIQGVSKSNVNNSAAISGIYDGAGAGYGVWGENQSTTAGSQGLMGINHRVNGGWGVEGMGVTGVYGRTNTPLGFGVRAENNSAYNTNKNGGVAIIGNGNVGVRGESQNAKGAGIYGLNVSPVNPDGDDISAGVYGFSNNGYGLVGGGANANSLGLYVTHGAVVDNFKVTGSVVGNLNITGTINKGGGTFKIDHPLDPENKYLYHSFVESPDMMNIYNGNATLNASGTATITLPKYFDVLNMDVKYQLTAIGTSMPNLYIAKEVSNGKFEIAGGAPNGKVSWQVTGVRQDPYAKANRVVPEVEKEAENKGKYLYPELYGHSETQSIYRRLPNKTIEKAREQSIMELKK